MDFAESGPVSFHPAQLSKTEFWVVKTLFRYIVMSTVLAVIHY